MKNKLEVRTKRVTDNLATMFEKNGSYKKDRKEKGITLSALVITIIILLILAGISLNLIAGSNGILNRAINAVSKTKQAQMEEELQLVLAEIMMDYYVEGNGKTLQEYILGKCNESEDGIFTFGKGMFATVDEQLSYTDSQGNTSVISISNNGEVTIEGGISADGTVNDDKAPSVSVTSTTNSITFVARDILSGVASWAYSETNEEPTTWNEVKPSQKSFAHTIENLKNGITYYIWVKDANGNKSEVKKIATKDFDELSYEVTWEGVMATVTVTSSTTGVQYLDESGKWQSYTGPLTREAGTSVHFKVTDGFNNIEYESIKLDLVYTIQYNANGGTGTMMSSSHEYGTAKNLSKNTFTKTGYTFAGWATSSNGTKVYEDEQSVNNLATEANATIELFAVWTVNRYTIVYNANGGTGTMASSSHEYGTAKNLTANAFSRTGYIFVGWNTASNGSGTNYSDCQSVENLVSTNGGSLTLYAKWQEINITLDKSSATVDAGDPNANTTKLTATVSPAKNIGLTWTSSDNSVATVDQNGNVTGQSCGRATITVTGENHSATANIVVNEYLQLYGDMKTAKTGGFTLNRDGTTPEYDSQNTDNGLLATVNYRNNYAAWVSNNSIDISKVGAMDFAYNVNGNYVGLTMYLKVGISNDLNANDQFSIADGITHICDGGSGFNGVIRVFPGSIASGHLKIFMSRGSEVAGYTSWNTIEYIKVYPK